MKDINIVIERTCKEIKSDIKGGDDNSEEEELEVDTETRSEDENSCSDARSTTDISEELIEE